MSDTLNVVISSKNKLNNDTNSSITVRLKEPIDIMNDEELTVCLQNFTMVKSFYACQSGLNDYFQVFFKQGSTVYETYDIFLSQGNYSVKSLMEEIKGKTSALFQISYDARLNKYWYVNNTFFDVYIKPINAGIFLGFENNTEYQIKTLEDKGTYSSKYINIAGYSHLIIKVFDITIKNTISNIYANEYQYDNILGLLNISDVAPMDTIQYEENGSGMFKHKIYNPKVSEFNIKIVNENGVEFPQMTDWLCVLKFEKTKNKNSFETIEFFLGEINFYLASLYNYLQIPSRLTYEDFIQS